MARDGFTSKIVRQLCTRVAYRCSNPECRVPTAAPKSGGNDLTSIGVACHIHAASSGGPRYQDEMSKAERISFDNGIWLCSNCSREIDSDVKKYSIEVLKQWKLKSEQTAGQELGRRLPRAEDATDLLKAAYGGPLQRKLIPNAISAIHNASSEVLEQLDPRFKVNTSYINGITQIEIHAKEDTTVTITPGVEHSEDFRRKLRTLLEAGEDFEIPSASVTVAGSKLFEEILSEQGKLKISSPKKDAILKVEMTGLDGTRQLNFDVGGVLSFGSKEFSFSGYAFNKILQVEFKKSLAGSKSTFPISMSFDLKSWQDISLLKLPYFVKVFELTEYLANGSLLSTCLEVEGLKILTGKAISLSKHKFIQQLGYFIRYVKAARSVADFLEVNPNFDFGISYTSQEYVDLLETENIINGQQVIYAQQISKKMTCNLTVHSMEILDLLKTKPVASSFTYTEDRQREITIFGHTGKLPTRHMVLNPVLLKPLSKLENKKAGDLIKLELIPQNGFTLRTIYDPSWVQEII